MSNMWDLNPVLLTHHSPRTLGCWGTPGVYSHPRAPGEGRVYRQALPLPELREAGLRTADPPGFVLRTKASGSRLSGE